MLLRAEKIGLKNSSKVAEFKVAEFSRHLIKNAITLENFNTLYEESRELERMLTSL